jgi:hypothetical protein
MQVGSSHTTMSCQPQRHSPTVQVVIVIVLRMLARPHFASSQSHFATHLVTLEQQEQQ